MFTRWECIFARMEGEYPLLDPGTVLELETLTPKYSTHDRAKIERMMQERKIFPAVTSEQCRSAILTGLLGVDGRILSFYTFYHDAIYFEACSKIMRGLLPPNFKDSIRDAFFYCFTGVNQTPREFKVQVMEDEILRYQGNVRSRKLLGYQQLFPRGNALLPDLDRSCSTSWGKPRKADHRGIGHGALVPDGTSGF